MPPTVLALNQEARNKMVDKQMAARINNKTKILGSEMPLNNPPEFEYPCSSSVNEMIPKIAAAAK